MNEENKTPEQLKMEAENFIPVESDVNIYMNKEKKSSTSKKKDAAEVKKCRFKSL